MRTLEMHLAAQAAGGPAIAAAAAIIPAIARSGLRLRTLVGGADAFERAPFSAVAGNPAAAHLAAEGMAAVTAVLRDVPVAAVAFPGTAPPRILDPGAPVVLAIDPLNGADGLETNGPVGTVFSLWPAAPSGDPTDALLQPGKTQLAAGFISYGPRMVAAITIGAGTTLLAFDPASEQFIVTSPAAAIPAGRREYAIRSYGYRGFDDHVRAFIDEVAGEDAHALSFSTRTDSPLLREVYRVLRRGGVFLQPGAAGPERNGRLSLVFEAIPIAFLIEQAGGEATTGRDRILDLKPRELGQKSALVFGSADHVRRIARYYDDLAPAAINRAPLFGSRGLFRE